MRSFLNRSQQDASIFDIVSRKNVAKGAQNKFFFFDTFISSPKQLIKKRDIGVAFPYPAPVLVIRHLHYFNYIRKTEYIFLQN